MFLSLGIVGTLQAEEKKCYDVIVKQQQQQEVVGNFEGYSAEEGYKFTLEDGTTMLFQTISPEILKTFDLSNNDDLKGVKFKVLYTTTKDDNGEYHTIVGLNKVE